MSKTIISSVPFQDPQGNAIINGKLVLDLSQNAEITSGGGQVAPKRVAITLDGSGNVPAATTLLANDELTPSGTTYTSTLYDSSGNFLSSLGKWSISGASPIDLSLMTPTITGATYPAPVLINPGVDQEITSGNLIIDQSLKVKNGTAFTLTLGGTPTANRTATLPDNSGTVAELNLAETWTAAQSFNDGTLVLKGATSGTTTLKSAAVAGTTTITYPATTGNGVVDSATQTLTNKTYGGTTFSKQVFTGSGTFTIPASVTSAKVTLVGAGGAGGGATAANNGGGGGSGGAALKWLTGLTPSNTITVTVGTGGTGVSAAAGNAGGASSISSGTQTITTVTANGGNGGSANGSQSSGGSGAAISTNGDANFGGVSGFDGIGVSGGPGAGSMFGGGGPNSNGGQPGNAALSTGGGGGGAGAGANRTGGAGANGIVIFEWVT